MHAEYAINIYLNAKPKPFFLSIWLYNISVNGTGKNAHIITLIMLMPTKEKYSFMPLKNSCTPNVINEYTSIHFIKTLLRIVYLSDSTRRTDLVLPSAASPSSVDFSFIMNSGIIMVSASGSTQYIRMQFNKAANGTWYNPIVIVAGEDMGAKVGDMITVVAEVSGVFEEQDDQGEPVMVPRFDLLFVDKVE